MAGLRYLGLLFAICPVYIRLVRNKPDDRADEKGAEMSAVELSHAHAATGFGGIVARVTAMIVAWNEARVTRRELSALSDRELTDIGLARGDIERVARGL